MVKQTKNENPISNGCRSCTMGWSRSIKYRVIKRMTKWQKDRRMNRFYKMNGVMLRRILNESWLPKGRKLRRELCLYLSFRSCVRRNRRWDTLDFMDGNMIGSQIAWERTIYETCFVFQACLIKRSSYWQQFKANSATQWHCDYFHFLTSAGGDLPPKHLSLVFFVSLGSMPLNAKWLVLYLGFLTYTALQTVMSCRWTSSSTFSGSQY